MRLTLVTADGSLPLLCIERIIFHCPLPSLILITNAIA